MTSFLKAAQKLQQPWTRWWPYAWRPGLFILLLLAMLMVYWVLLHASHLRMQEQVRTDTQQLAGQSAQALALHMNTVVRKLDYFAQHLSWVWMQDNDNTFNDAASRAIQTLPPGALVQVAVANAQGEILYSNLNPQSADNPSQPPVFITDREHFTVHSSADTPFFFISEPIKGRISQQWTIQFTRGMWRNGEFQGVMVLAVSAEYLATALKTIFPDTTDAASLVNHKGTYLARSYYLTDALGTTLPHNRSFIQFPEITHGFYEAIAGVDGISRLYSWTRVDNYPLVILVGMGTDKATALTNGAITDSHWQSGFGSGLLLVGGLVVAWLWAQRSMRATQLENTANALRASEARLRITMDAVRDGLWNYDHSTRISQWDQQIRNMLGYGDDYHSPSIQTLIDLIHPADLSRLQYEYSQALNNGSRQHVMNLEFRLRKADNRWLWVLARGGVIERSADGAPVLSVGTLSDISERVAEDMLRNALLDRSAAAIVLVSPDRRVVDANAQFAAFFLKPGQAPKDVSLPDIHIDHSHWEQLATSYDTVRTKGLHRQEYPFRLASGEIRWFDTHAVLQDPDDPESNVIWTWVDVTSQHEADAALAVETLRLNTLLECFPGGVLIEDARDNVVFVNPMWTQLLDVKLSPTDLLGKHDSELRALVGPKVSSWLRSNRPGRSPESRRSHEVITNANNYLEIDHVEIRQHRKYLGSVWLIRDSTRRKLHELELARLASTDTLTALPNRRSFMEQLNALHREAQLQRKITGVVMQLDIDHFKRVNDTYGHAIGDIVLQNMAGIIRNTLRGNDIPGRLGGEEFGVLLPYTNLTEGQNIAERIRKNIQDAIIDADGHPIQITISIGVSVVSADHTPDTALRQADQALYHAKESGRNRVCLWDESLTPDKSA